MKFQHLLLALLALSVMPGCATITSNEMQSVALTTKSGNGDVVEKARCALKNDKGTWESDSPGFVQVRRSAEDLQVECNKDGHARGMLRAVSRAAGGMWGNIIFGGGVGAIIDHNKGTGYSYPHNLPVVMGTTVIIDRKDEQQAELDKQAGLETPDKPLAAGPR